MLKTVTSEIEKWKLDNGQLTMDNGQWIMDNGQWKLDNGKQTMENGKRKTQIVETHGRASLQKSKKNDELPILIAITHAL
ncbi:MAG: hypothetical protein PHG64_06030 [Paludibacter sp.]|nr:hypothetical protein [Paludibacter sp.]